MKTEKEFSHMEIISQKTFENKTKQNTIEQKKQTFLEQQDSPRILSPTHSLSLSLQLLFMLYLSSCISHHAPVFPLFSFSLYLLFFLLLPLFSCSHFFSVTIHICFLHVLPEIPKQCIIYYIAEWWLIIKNNNYSTTMAKWVYMAWPIIY